jgi:biotin transporter BioY
MNSTAAGVKMRSVPSTIGTVACVMWGSILRAYDTLATFCTHVRCG